MTLIADIEKSSATPVSRGTMLAATRYRCS